MMSRRLLTPLLLLAQLLLCGAPLMAGGHKGVNLYSIPQEIELGRRMASEVETQAHIVDDPIISEYVNRVGQNLAKQANAPFSVTVKMIQSSEINAFTLPGGYVYVNSSILMMADNEAEFASVLAHEIGHAAARHATRQQSGSQLAKIIGTPLGILIPGLAGVAARQAAGVAAPVTSLHFSRAFETEADKLGVHYLYGAGYDPAASIDMFEKIASTERATPGRVAKLFLSHPPTQDRIRKTQGEIRKLNPERGSYILNTSDFEAIRKRLYDHLM
ncbi:MAG TPA: M48 family metallopeptidase [Bryobacteraceae bacterium]|nr:M48 family metallopeptidase [Bryobacteraceae bacterium]